DAKSTGTQYSVRLRPSRSLIGSWLVDGTYTFSNVRTQTRGFDATTSGVPQPLSWARSAYSSRHELTLSAGFNHPWIAVTAFGKLRSGVPFTPIVGSDINGDGLANDRAFVFGGGNVDSLSSALRRLLESTSGASADCLRRQINQIAQQNSCEGP